MKIKHVLLGLGLGLSILSGCDDTLHQVGMNTMPESDGVIVYADTFYIKGRTVKTDSVYARTIYGSLGEIYDPLYGNLKSDYLCQFYCPENFSFKKTPINGKVDSVEFRILYSSWVGDSLAPMTVQLYEVNKALPRYFYTNADPKDYYNPNSNFGVKSYTAYDVTVPDSVRKAVDSNGNYTFQPSVKIKMPLEIGQRFYDQTQNNPASFKNQETFNEFFPGIYVTTTMGTGNILNIDASIMSIYYKYIVKGSAGQDSIVKTNESFSVTSEVVQLNRIQNENLDDLLKPSDEFAYIKSPSGVYTELTIPAKEIAPIIKGRILSNLSFNLKAEPQEKWDFAFKAPDNLLLLPKDSVDTFFNESKVENNKTSYRGQYTASTRTYTFGNISNLLKDHIEKAPEKDLVLSVIPVERKTSTSSDYYGTSTEYTSAISNFLRPAGVKLRIDKDAMEIRVVSIKYKE